jgi:hypothetical protein
LGKNSDSVEQSLLYSVGALIESIGCRGRAAPSAPRESGLARNAGLEGPLFHGGVHSIEVSLNEHFSLGNRGFRNLFCGADKHLKVTRALASEFRA